MRDTELEARLRTAVDHAAPDDVERLLAACDSRPQLAAAPAARRRSVRWAPLAMAAVLLLMCGGAFGMTRWHSAHAVASVVSLDVNPSIELQVNRQEKVLSAQALNDDAAVILEGMDLRGTPLNVAVNAIVGSLLQHGYLDSLSSAILISVEDGDPQRATRLETALSREVDAALRNASAGAAILSRVVTQDAGLEALARDGGVSVGKAALIRDIQAQNAALAFDDLAELSVEELDQLLSAGAPALPVGKNAAAYAAQAHAGLLELDAVTWEVDPELDETPAHYEVELSTHFGKFEYDVDAWTGEVLKGPANVLAVPAEPPRPDPPVPSSAADIGPDRAAAIALADAGVARADAAGLRVKADSDDGVALYEVEFRAGGSEYEYDVRASDGAILKAEREGGPAPAGAGIGPEAALQTALAHAGVSPDSVSDRKTEADEDDGVLVYEVEFRAGDTQYEYEIAADGTVLKAERETED